jgi:hypothetical protein
VLITQPESGKATGLYYTSDEYVDLERLVQTSEPVDAPPPESLDGTTYIVTWLVHDVMIWRTDFVHIGALGGPYVLTRTLENDGVMGERSTWARVTDGKALARLLERALDGRPAQTLLEPSTPQTSAPEAAAGTPTPAAEPATRWFSLSGWRWAVVGLLGGLLASVVVRRRRPAPQDEPLVVEDLRERISRG